MLDRAEQRSKQLGIAKAPLNEANHQQQQQHQEAAPQKLPSGGVTTVKRQNTRRKSTTASPQKQKSTLTMTRNVTGSPSKRALANTPNEAEASKENLDVALEINITAGHNVQVIT